MRELDLISKSLKGTTDKNILRKDFVVFEKNLALDAAPFIRDVATRAKRENKSTVMLIAILK
jgi:hypothetical protein